MLVSFSLNSKLACADEAKEKLKLEIEKLKLENEKLRLNAQGAEDAGDPRLKACLQNKNVEKCWEFYGDENISKGSAFAKDVQRIKDVAKVSCKKSKDDGCSLLSKIMYSEDKDPAAIPIMESYCLAYTKKDMSMRCQDLTDFYTGMGAIQPSAIDAPKAERFARMCLKPSARGNCLRMASSFLFSKRVPLAEAKRISTPLLKAALVSKDYSDRGQRKIEFFLGCKVELIVEKPAVASISHISSWIRYTNLSKYPFWFKGELKASLSNDSSKQFIDTLVGNTLSFGRVLNPRESIREKITFEVDDNRSNQFLPYFKVHSFRATQLGFEEDDLGDVAERICDFQVKYE